MSTVKRKKPAHRAEPKRPKILQNLSKGLFQGAVALAVIGAIGPSAIAHEPNRLESKVSVDKEVAIKASEIARTSTQTPVVKPVTVEKAEVRKTERASFTASAPIPGEKRSTSLITTGKIVEEKESKWVSPIPSAGISSPFGPRGAIKAAGTMAGLHNGIDLGAPFGTPINAAFDGEVIHVGFTDFDTHTGGVVVLLHKTAEGDYLTSYNHMKSSGINVKVGDHVKSGEKIAEVASEGLSTGPHLHFSVREVTGENPLEDWEILEPRSFLQSNGVNL